MKDNKGTDKGIQNEIEGQDGGYAWVILISSFFLNFIGDGVPYAFGLFYVEIAKAFPEVGKSGTAWISSIMIAVFHGAGPIASILVNKFGWRTVSTFGSFLAGGGFAVSYWAQNTETMYFTIGIVAGFGVILLYLPAMVSVPEYFSRRRSFAVGVSVAGSGMGTFFFSWAFGLILTVYTWRQGLLITGIILFATFLLGFVYPAQKSNQPSSIITEKELSSRREDACGWRDLLDLKLLRDWAFVVFSVADLVTSMGYNVPYTYLPEIEQTATLTDSSSVLIVMGGANVGGRILFGYLSDKNWMHRIYLYTAFLFVAGAVTIASPHVGSIGVLRGLWGLYGLCMGGYITLKPLILVDLLGLGKLTDSLGLLLLFQAFGFLLGAPIVGLFYDNFGSYTFGFYFVGLMVVVSGVMVGSIPWLQGRRERKSISKVSNFELA